MRNWTITAAAYYENAGGIWAHRSFWKTSHTVRRCMASLQCGCGSAGLMLQSDGNTWSRQSRCKVSLLCGCEGESSDSPCGWTLGCTLCSGRGCSPVGKSAVWSFCFLLWAADIAAEASAGTDRSAAAASWAGGSSDCRTYRCGGWRRGGQLGPGLRRLVMGLVIWQVVLPTGRCLETLRRRTDDLWVVEQSWSGLEDELLNNTKCLVRLCKNRKNIHHFGFLVTCL